MEIDQLIFKRLFTFYKKVTAKSDPEVEARTVYLEPLKPRLTILARALSGFQNDVVSAEREGGWSDLTFFLPNSISFNQRKEDNVAFYLFRVLYLSVQQKLNLNWGPHEIYSEAESREHALVNANLVLEHLFTEYPPLEQIHQAQKENLEAYFLNEGREVDYSWLYGKWMKTSQQALSAQGSGSQDQQAAQQVEITTELEANPSDEVETIAINQKQVEDNVLQNQFEKVDTASEFNGTFREMDGEDTLSDDEAAIRELKLKHTVRTDEINHSVYQAEFVNGKVSVLVDDVTGASAYQLYDEWDYKQRRYKSGFCKVYASVLTKQADAFTKELVHTQADTRKNLVRLFSKLYQEYERILRVNSGDDIDLDAAVDAIAAIYAGKTPSENIYSTKRKRKKDLSVLILMDTSLSAESFTDNMQVLEVEKEAVYLLGEVLNEYGITFQIDTFSSRTRNNCRYQHLKRFQESWHETRNRIGAVEADAYTRIGTALRHAGSLIDKEKTKEKWILLLSDGKPNDYDTYEGKYGIEDVKKALSELNNRQIRTFSLAIEKQAKYYLPQMFGHANYSILSRPAALPLALGKFFRQLLKN